MHVIRGVIEAESGAIEHYNHIIEETDSVDPATQDMVIDILRDEQGHRRLFEGYLREFEEKGPPELTRHTGVRQWTSSPCTHASPASSSGATSRATSS